MGEKTAQALKDFKWKAHSIGDTYLMDGDSSIWKIVYYPLIECGKTKEQSNRI